MNVGNRIKQRRLRLGITAKDLAYEIGKSRATIYRYENGDIENMPTTVLEPLARTLHTTPAFLMGWDDDPEDDETLANEYGIYPPNNYDGSLEDWIKSKRATDEDSNQEIGHIFDSKNEMLVLTYANTATPEEFEKLIKPYRSLDDPGRTHVDSVLTWELERSSQLLEAQERITELEFKQAYHE